MAYQFGEIPLRVYRDSDGNYNVLSEDQSQADECAVDAQFPPDRLDTMHARAAAYGYQLSTVEAPTPVIPETAAAPMEEAQ